MSITERMYSGKNIYSRGRRGGGGNYQNQQQGQGQGQGSGCCGGRGRGGNHSGCTDQQQRTTRSPIQGNSGGFRGFRPPIQRDRQQLSVQGQRYGPKQGEGPSSGRRGIWRERPWGSTPPLPPVPPQRARSTLDNLVIEALKISEQPASPAESVENRIVPLDRGGTLAIQSILGSLLRTFLKNLILWLLYFAMLWISSM